MKEDFGQACWELLNRLLLEPAAGWEFWTMVGVAFVAMVFLLFQTQVHFGASRTALPAVLLAIFIAGGLVFCGTVAVWQFVFPMIPESFLNSLHSTAQSLAGEREISWETVENILLVLTAVVLTALLAGPLTAGFLGSRYIDAFCSWLAVFIGGGIVIFVVHFGIQMIGQSLKTSDSGQQRQLERAEEREAVAR